MQRYGLAGVHKQRGKHIALLAGEIERLVGHQDLYRTQETELHDNHLNASRARSASE
jgi:hypothetical protein